MLGASSSGRGGGIQSARSRSTNGKSSTSKMENTGNEINLVPPSTQPSFDMLVLGCGGGPAENDLSAYWVKPAGQAWRDGFISVDGGSCLGALVRLLESHPLAFRDFIDHRQSLVTTSSEQQHLQQQQHHRPSQPDTGASSSSSTLLQAGKIYDMLQAFLVTHAHWDHISGLVLSSSSGSLKQKTVYGSKQTISNLANAMNGGLWPVLGSYEAANGVPYVWRDVELGKAVTPIQGLSASIMPLSHGIHHQGTSYESSAFFLESDSTNRSLLIFGDVEPDSISGLSLNRSIWSEAAKRIQEGRLSSILLECSYCSSRPKNQLYGHLSPIYIAEELRVLASLLPPRSGLDASDLKGRLEGVTICIIHVKDPTSLAEVQDITPSSTSTTDSQAPTTKKARTSPPTMTSSSAPVSTGTSPTRRRTRSSSSKNTTQITSSQTPLSTTTSVSSSKSNLSSDTSLPEGIKLKIYNELMELEKRDMLGVRYLMLEQGMRIRF